MFQVRPEWYDDDIEGGYRLEVVLSIAILLIKSNNLGFPFLFLAQPSRPYSPGPLSITRTGGRLLPIRSRDPGNSAQRFGTARCHGFQCVTTCTCYTSRRCKPHKLESLSSFNVESNPFLRPRWFPKVSPSPSPAHCFWTICSHL